MHKLLTAQDVAEILQVPIQWVWKEAREGRLPAVPALRRKKRFDPGVIQKLYFTGSDGTGVPRSLKSEYQRKS